MNKGEQVQFSNRVYDFFKWLVQIALPAFGTLYFALSEIWEFPNGERVVGTTTATALFFGALIGISKMSYDKNVPVVDPPKQLDGMINIDNSDPDKEVYSLDLEIPVEELAGRDFITFGVSDLYKPRKDAT